MRLYAVMSAVGGIVSETISTNPDLVKADMFRLQSRDATQTYYVSAFDEVEKLTPPTAVWVSEAIVATVEATPVVG